MFIDYFSRKFAARYQQPIWKPDAAALLRFCEYRWPGNVRQLSFVIEQAYVLQCEPKLPGSPQAGDGRSTSLPFTNLGRLRRAAVEQALRLTNGHKGQAAEMLGVHPNTLTRLLTQLHDEQ